MAPISTISRNLPVPSGAGSHFAPAREAPRASFLSQLIAERHHLAPQRHRRQAPILEVLRTYDAGGRLKLLRLPPGSRLDVDA